MKVVISDSKNSNLLAPQIIVNLKNFGVEVISFYQSDYYEDLLFLEKIFHKIYPIIYYRKVNKVLLDLIDKHNPDYFLLFKGMEVFPTTLKKIKSKGIKILNYNPDHPFEFISPGSGNKNVRDSIVHFDNYITYSYYIQKQLNLKYEGLKTSVLPFGHMVSDSDFTLIKDEEEINQVAFVGYADDDRYLVIKHLITNGINVHVFGDNWINYSGNGNLFIYKSVSGIDYYRVLRRFRIQLNLLRKHNHDSHNMRSFEIPAVGGIMLTERTSEHLKFFTENRESFYYSDLDELVVKIHQILSFSNTQSNIIREAARNRSIVGKYNYEDRSRQLISIIKNT